MKILAGISLFLALTVGAFAETFVDKDNGFTITGADGWVKKDPDTHKMPYAALKLQTMGPVVNQRALLYVDIFDQDPQSATTDMYVNRMKAYITGEMNGQILSEENVTVSGLPAKKITYKGTAKEFTNNDDKFVRLVVHSNNGRYYVVHGVSQHDNFNMHASDFDKMLSSFQLNP